MQKKLRIMQRIAVLNAASQINTEEAASLQPELEVLKWVLGPNISKATLKSIRELTEVAHAAMLKRMEDAE